MKHKATSPRMLAAVCAALAVLTLAAFHGVLSNGFVTYDDDVYVTANTHVQKGLSSESIAWAFTTADCANWHPLTWLSHMLDVQLFGLKAGRHHLTSLLLHVFNVLLLFLLLVRMTGALWRCAFVAALFAIHPLHVESVAWIAERKDVLSTFLWLLTLAAWLGYVGSKERRGRIGSSNAGSGARSGGSFSGDGLEATRGRGTSRLNAGIAGSSTPTRRGLPAAAWYALVLVLFALGLMAKPMLVTLPFTLLLLDWWPLGRWDGGAGRQPEVSRGVGLRRQEDRSTSGGTDAGRVRSSGGEPHALSWLALEKAPLFAMSAVSCVVTFVVQRGGGAVQTIGDLAFPDRLWNAVLAYASYLVKMIWPVSLAIFYPRAQAGAAGWQVAASVLVLVGITMLAVRLARRAPYFAVGWFWYVGTLVPVIGLVQVGEQAMADRYTYVPLIGIFILVAWGLSEFAGRGVPRPAARSATTVVAIVIVLLLAVVTWKQVGYWRDGIALLTHAIGVTRDNAVAHTNLGVVLEEEGHADQAVPHMREAVRLTPGFARAHDNLGLALDKAGRDTEALGEYEEALRLIPGFADAHAHLGLLLARTGRYPEAVEHLREALERKPDSADAHFNLGMALAGADRIDAAIEQYNEALRLSPEMVEAHHGLGVVLVRKGLIPEAIQHYEQALRLRPGFGEVRNSLGIALARSGRMREAAGQFEEAVRLRPDFGEARANLRAAREALARQAR